MVAVEMRAISRRLGRLEGRLGPVETEHTRYLMERLEAAHRRMALAGYPVHLPGNLSGLTVEQILNRGRPRARQAASAEEAQNAIVLDIP